MKKYLPVTIATLLLTLLPTAYCFALPTNFKDLIENTVIKGILAPMIPLIIGIAVIIFIYGVFKLVVAEGSEEKQAGKEFMFWGIVGLFLILSLWGLVSILTHTFNLDNTNFTPIQATIPKVL